MHFKSTSYLVAAAVSAVVFFGNIAAAQELDAAHIGAAKKAMGATKATNGFDQILPDASIRLKNQLVSTNPDKADQIDLIVDEEALNLAARRGDLENEAAKLFAKSFSAEELTKIAEFFDTPAGQKYLDSTPILARQLSKAARIWANGIQRDLAANAAKRVGELNQ